MTKRFSIIFAAVLFVTVLPGLSIATISGPFTTTTPISAALTDWQNTLSFPKFDSSLGTLTMVQLDLSGSMSTVITATNHSPGLSSVEVYTHLQVTVQDSGLNLSSPEIDLVIPTFYYTLAGGQSLTSDLLTKSDSSTDLYTASAVLSEFTGPGTIVLDANTYTETYLTYTGGNIEVGQLTYAELTGTVTYTYEAPEPTTVGLLCLGGPAIILRKKTRLSKNTGEVFHT
jgi:hypothetical protein